MAVPALSASLADREPTVQLEVRAGTGRPTTYDLTGAEFLIGGVPGCDLRLPGANVPPMVALIARTSEGLRLRKLAPTYPLLLNGQPATQAPLVHGDTLSGAGVEVRIHVSSPAAPVVPTRPAHGLRFIPVDPQPTPVSRLPTPHSTRPTPHSPLAAPYSEAEQARQRDWVRRHQELERRAAELDTAAQELDEDRALWYARRTEMEREAAALARLADERTALDERAAQLQQFAQQLEQQALAVQQLPTQRADLERRERALAEQLANARRAAATDEERIAHRAEELAQAEQTHAEYQRRRDVALAQIAEREAELTAREAALADLEAREATVAEQLATVQALATRLAHAEPMLAQADELRLRELALATAERELAERESALQDWTRERTDWQAQADAAQAQLQATQAAQAELARQQSEYQADVVRLERRAGQVEQMLAEQARQQRELDRQADILQADTLELEEQARQLDANRTQFEAERTAFESEKQHTQQAAAKLAERTAALEGQQALVTTLRSRLERQREELRLEAQQLAGERARQDEMARTLNERLREAEDLRTGLVVDTQGRHSERQHFEQRSAALQAAVTQLRQVQERLASEEDDLHRRSATLTQQEADLEEQRGLVLAQTQQLVEQHRRLEGDRQAIQTREAALNRDDEARRVLQEQLRRRTDELAARQRALDAERALFADEQAQVQQQRANAEQTLADATTTTDARSADLAQRVAELAIRHAELDARAAEQATLQADLLAQAEALTTDRTAWLAEQESARHLHTAAQAELAQFQQTVLAQAERLQLALPDLDDRAALAVERLTAAREQLHGHLTELHTFARQSQDDLLALRGQIRTEAEQWRTQDESLARARAEHRLAVSGFRQQLVEWQGRVAAMKQALAQDEARLEKQQAAVTAAQEQAAVTAEQLARRSEDLQAEHRAITERRDEMERHLHELREWYRSKLRELADSNGKPVPALPTDDIDPGDRQLGELLRTLGLIDADTMAGLWQEARRQRRTLRQVLLASGFLTLYQLALIEQGQFDRLVLGPVRIGERLQATAHETLYRVTDPRRPGHEGLLLRHLSEADAQDAVRPDEYRQRFASLIGLSVAQIPTTFEVFDVQGRPAILQEWPSGLPATDWTGVNVPGVWLRLVTQAVQALEAAHGLGLYHGRLSASQCVLTAGGVLKVLGLGEPAWLTDTPSERHSAPIDLADLGQLASYWASASVRRKGSRNKPFPPDLLAIATQMSAGEFASATAVRTALATVQVPAADDAWERLLDYVVENTTDGPTSLRLSA
jgi:chromosome segregation ATPase